MRYKKLTGYASEILQEVHMESEAISIDKCLDSDAEQRFDFLYENYSVLKAIIKDYRENIINDVIEMKSFNTQDCGSESAQGAAGYE